MELRGGELGGINGSCGVGIRNVSTVEELTVTDMSPKQAIVLYISYLMTN